MAGTANSAKVMGLIDDRGTIEVGKRADLVLWNPAFFGAKPEMVLIGGCIVVAQMGDPNASIPTPQPVYTRPMFGAFGRSVERSAVVFVSAAAAEALAQAVGATGPRAGADSLSHREHQVFRLLVTGQSVGQIGAQLGLAANTVSTYRARILEKTGTRNDVELALYAERLAQGGRQR